MRDGLTSDTRKSIIRICKIEMVLQYDNQIEYMDFDPAFGLRSIFHKNDVEFHVI